MQQLRQIVKISGKQMDIEDLIGSKHPAVSFHSIAWMIISVNVTIYRTMALPESYEINHYIITTKLRSCI
jgi:hypothetical protein